MKFLIDSGSPVTLIPEYLFNKLNKSEPFETTYKDVNNQKIEFIGQTKAMVKANKEETELPILITKAQTSPLMGLDWLQRLNIKINSDKDGIQIHNIKLDKTEKRITKLQNNFETYSTTTKK